MKLQSKFAAALIAFSLTVPAVADCVWEENEGDHPDNAADCYRNNKLNGHWVLRFAGGNVAEGPYVDGKKSGHWVLRLTDGTVQEGSLVYGARHGNWVYRFTTGEIVDVKYTNGEAVGAKPRE